MDQVGVAGSPRRGIVRARGARYDLMGSAPVRRSFEARLLSSQRRGAYVGPGAPGVRRVRHPRPRQQVTPAGEAATWLVSYRSGDDGWAWDAGLYLQPEFTNMGGYPLSLPSGCDSLHFVVLDPAMGGSFLDNTYNPPWAEYWIDGSGNHHILTSSVAGDPGNETGSPNTGSHLWIQWVGPTADPTVDPMPPMHPSTLVPASLAENGTG